MFQSNSEYNWGSFWNSVIMTQSIGLGLWCCFAFIHDNKVMLVHSHITVLSESTLKWCKWWYPTLDVDNGHNHECKHEFHYANMSLVTRIEDHSTNETRETSLNIWYYNNLLYTINVDKPIGSSRDGGKSPHSLRDIRVCNIPLHYRWYCINIERHPFWSYTL